MKTKKWMYGLVMLFALTLNKTIKGQVNNVVDPNSSNPDLEYSIDGGSPIFVPYTNQIPVNIKICKGQTICFRYRQQLATPPPPPGIIFATYSFSNGDPNLQVPNYFYYPSVCVDYRPSSAGTIFANGVFSFTITVTDPSSLTTPSFNPPTGTTLCAGFNYQFDAIAPYDNTSQNVYFTSATPGAVKPGVTSFVWSFQSSPATAVLTAHSGLCNQVEFSNTYSIVTPQINLVESSIGCNNLTKNYHINTNCYLFNPFVIVIKNAANTIIYQQNITSNNFSFTYPSVGNYTIKINNKTGTSGLTNTFINQNITIAPPNIPSFNITSSTSNLICGNVVSFNATATDGGTNTYAWQVKDALTGAVINAPITNGNTANPSINFAGIYQNVNVCATAINQNGCTATECLLLTSCCATPAGYVKYNNYTYSANTTVHASKKIQYAGTITINNGAHLLLTNTNVIFDASTKIVINGTGKLTVTKSYLRAGCNTMWDGIYVNGTGLITFNDSRIEDATSALNDVNGTASFNLTGNVFNKNDVGFNLQTQKSAGSNFNLQKNIFTCSNIPAPTTIGANLTAVAIVPNLASALVYGNYPIVNLLPPFQYRSSEVGLLFVNAGRINAPNNVLIVGLLTGNENIFDKQTYGVSINNSSLSFQNNVFQNNDYGTTIFNTSGQNPYNINYGGSLALKNNFIKNKFGIYNYGVAIITASYNKFSNNETGMYFYRNNLNSTVNIASNRFINHTIGVNFDDNNFINGNVLNNWFENQVVQGNNSNNFAIRFTENQQSVNKQYAKFEANNNNISGYFNGVFVAQTYKSAIKDNEIHLRSDDADAHYQAGIQITRSNDNDVFNNLVDVQSFDGKLRWWQFGLFTSLSTVPKMHCNYLKDLGAGILANGYNLTEPGNGFNGNTMYNCQFGFWLNAQGEIGDQYNTDFVNKYSADNAWYNCQYETFSNQGCNTFNGTGALFIHETQYLILLIIQQTREQMALFYLEIHLNPILANVMAVWQHQAVV